MENREIEAIVREVLTKLEDSRGGAEGLDWNLPNRSNGGSDQDASSRSADGSSRNLPNRSNGGWNQDASSRSADRLSRNLPDCSSAVLTEAEASPRLADANGGKMYVTMPLALAVKLIERIEAKAAEWDMRVVTAVSDAAGRPVAVHCMDGAYIGSFDVALNKTYTSIAFQMSTAQLGTLSGPGGSLYGIQFTNEGKIVIFGGGEVLKKDGVIVGALGVSGGSAEQDTALAAYGKDIFMDL